MLSYCAIIYYMKTIYYKLTDIEFWLYNGKNLPKLISNKDFSNFINYKFSKNQFAKIRIFCLFHN